MIRINIGILMIATSIAGVIAFNIMQWTTGVTMFYVLLGFGLFQLENYWEVLKFKSDERKVKR